MSERAMIIKAAGETWNVIVSKWADNDYSVFAETKHFCYDPLWQGDHEPSSVQIMDLLESQMEAEAEAAWESSLQRYHRV